MKFPSHGMEIDEVKPYLEVEGISDESNNVASTLARYGIVLE